MQAEFRLFFSWYGTADKQRDKADASCKFPCNPSWNFCCDNEWVPRTLLSNLASPATVVSEIHSIEALLDSNATGRCVQLGWSLTVTASFDTTLDFHKFPFDRQVRLRTSAPLATPRIFCFQLWVKDSSQYPFESD